MNKTILMGRFTRDPEIRYTQGENSMCIANFSLAVDRPYKRDRKADEPTADFISCVAFGKLAEHVEKYYKKGMKTALEGRIQTRNYTNKNGQKVYVTEVIAERMEFAESKNASNGAQQGGYQQQQGGYQQGGYQQPQGGYQNQPPQNQGGYQQNGYGQQGGYQQPQGSYQNQPPQNQNQGGYQQNGYGQQGGYQQPQGGYQNQPPQNQGGYAPNNQTDGFMNLPDGIDEELPFT